MGFLDYVAPVVGGVSSVVGLIQAGQARQRALEQQQQALQAYGQASDRQYQNMLGSNSRTLYGLAGQGGTALANLGANMGGALAGAGVYNSSATAGALDQAQRDQGANLANLAAQNAYSANAFYDQAQQHLAQMRLGQSNVDYGNANADLQGSRQGLGHFLGALATSDLLGQGAGADSTAAAPNPDYGRLLQQGGITEADLTGGGAPGQGTSVLQGYDPNSPLGFGGRQAALDGGPGSSAAMGALTQANLANSGANAYRTALPQMPGTLRQGANLGGNAGWPGTGQAQQGGGGYSAFPARSYTGWSGLLDRYTTGTSGPLSGR